jgi:alkylated DNA repair dioxygenase AlkB
LDVFGAEPRVPEGFFYQRELITPAHEAELSQEFRHLRLEEFQFHGFVGKRRVISFGWKYDFDDQSLKPAPPIPAFLLRVRDLAAAFGKLPADQLVQALVIEYSAGAAIGWHRDRDVFGDVIGVSLLSPCRFRFRRKAGGRWERFSLTVEPRSAYLLSGPAREDWEHSIPGVQELRYSITFRTLRR